MDRIVDIKVKQSLARLRRGLISIDWRGRRGRADEDGDASGVDDILSYYAGFLRSTSVGWGPDADTGVENLGLRWRPSPEMNAFVQRLSATIDAEGSVLAGLSARARDEARRIALAQARAAGARLALSRPGEDEAARPLDEEEDAAQTMREALSASAETALEAALAAVRAGACARGLVTSGGDRGDIGAALAAMREDLESEIAAIEDRGAQIAALVADIRGAGRAIDDEFPDDGASRAHGNAAALRAGARLAAIATAGEAAARIAHRVADEAAAMAGLVDALSERFVAILRESPAADRRRSRRIAFDAQCRLTSVTRSYPGRILDISLGGALIDLAAAGEFRRGQPLRLHLADLPPVAASVAGTSAQGLHVSFDLGHAANAQARPAFIRILSALHDRDEMFVERAIALAAGLRDALEGALSQGVVTASALFARERTEAADRLLRDAAKAVLAPATSASTDIVYATAFDRRGSVAHVGAAVDDGLVAELGENRADAAGRRHARNRGPYLAQNLRLGERHLRSVSAPVHLGGVHWGCVEIAFRPPQASADGAEIGVLFEQDQG